MHPPKLDPESLKKVNVLNITFHKNFKYISLNRVYDF